MDWPLLASLTEAERQEFLALGRRRSFAKHEVVCHAGDPADSLHLVIGGRLSVRVSLPSGDTAMINVLGPGSYFGELALLRTDGHRTATITALEAAGRKVRHQLRSVRDVIVHVKGRAHLTVTRTSAESACQRVPSIA